MTRFSACVPARGPVCVRGHQNDRKHHDRDDSAAVHVCLHRSPALQGDSEGHEDVMRNVGLKMWPNVKRSFVMETTGGPDLEPP